MQVTLTQKYVQVLTIPLPSGKTSSTPWHKECYEIENECY